MNNKQSILSIVVGCRNDNHGQGMLDRFQHFLDCLFDQSQKKAHIEIIIVEWNPPTGTAPLSEVLRWPDKLPCTVRVIRVDSKFHDRLPNSDRLPFYQYIAKNVGIRRARGEFVLSTNIDILFSQGLFDRISIGELNEHTIYRADRLDVRQDIPKHSSAQQKLAFCEKNVLRAYRAWGIVEGPAAFNPPPPHFSPRSIVGGTSLNSASLATAIRATASSAKQALIAAINESQTLVQNPSYKGFQNLCSLVQTFQPISEGTFAFRRYPQLHTVACGDFILMHRNSWRKLRGHPEFPVAAMYIDGMTLYHGLACGMTFVDFPPEMPCYHIEHEGGWTPETKDTYFQKLSDRNIPYFKKSTYARWAEYCFKKRKPPRSFINSKNWGLGDQSLEEIRLD